MSEIILNGDARLNELAVEINTIKRQAAQTILAAACEIGKRLTEAKNNLPHGKWTSWLRANVDYSDRTAQQLMRCWEEYGRTLNPQTLSEMEGLTLSKAIALLGVDPEKRSELVLSGEAEELSTRELNRRIAELKEENEKRQVRIEELEEVAERLVGEADMESMARDTALDELEERVKTAEQLAARLKLDKDAADATVKRAEREAREARKELKEAEAREKAEKKKTEEAVRRAESVKPEKVTEIVEVTPTAVTEELDRLRDQLRTAPNVHIIRIREAYDRVTAEFGHIIDALVELTPEESEPYKAAFRRGLAAMAERLV